VQEKMRLMLLEEKEKNIYRIMKITEAFFDDNIFGVEDEENNMCTNTVHSNRQIAGFSFRDIDGDWWYVVGIEKDICNEICRKLLINGIADLTMYDECQYNDVYNSKS
jgi:hypothetical protein